MTANHQPWTDRFAHMAPSVERIKADVELADKGGEIKDVQAALSRAHDLISLLAEENLGFYRRGVLNSETRKIMENRVALVVAFQSGRIR